MIFRAIVGILIVLIGCSRNQQPPKSGLQIEKGPNHGVGYTDSLGTKYNVRYIPITITNDSTIPIHLQIAFLKEYDYPIALGAEKFKVFLIPKELTPDKVTYDSVSYELGNNELRNYFDRGLNPSNILNETLEPGKKCVIAIGTIYPRPPKVCGVLASELFVHSDRGAFTTCDWLMKEDPSSSPQIALGLKLTLRESCMIISCGQISYP